MSIINKLPTYRIFFGIFPTIIACLILIFLMSSRKEADVELRLLSQGVSFSQKGGILLKDIPIEAISITDFNETVFKPQSFFWKKITPAGNIRRQEISWGIGIQLLPVGNNSRVEVIGDKIGIAELRQGDKAKAYLQIKGDNAIEINLDGEDGRNNSKIKLTMTDLVKLKIKGCNVGRVNEPIEKGMPEIFWMIPSARHLEFSPKKDRLRIQMKLLPETKGLSIFKGKSPLSDFKFDRDMSKTISFQRAGTSPAATDETLLVNGKMIQTRYASLAANNLQVKEIRLDDNKENWIITMSGKTKSLRIGQTQDNLTEHLPSCLDDIYQHSSWILIFLILVCLFAIVMAFLG
ncbi:MAG: hypothetical protein QME49_08965 [bacterium]|nr:hypothetical protein [bacterium]